MAIRIGIDLDGTVADLSAAYHAVEGALFGEHTETPVVDESEESAAETPAAPALDDADERMRTARGLWERREQIWRTIRATHDFWTSLEPLEPGVLGRLHASSLTHGWEVFFVTQRPATAGQTVQRQTQQWLARHGFPEACVLTLTGSRGRAAAALELDVLVDDLPKNCVDVVSDSRCRPILVLRSPDENAERAARRMSIGVVRSVAEAVDLLEAPGGLDRPSALKRIVRALGFSAP